MQPKTMMVWLFIATLGLTNCQVTVNQSIEIEDGKKIRNDLNTINGNIVIGRECLVQGTCRTVNGSIEVGEQSEVYELQTVNGSIRIGHDVISRAMFNRSMARFGVVGALELMAGLARSIATLSLKVPRCTGIWLPTTATSSWPIAASCTAISW